MASMGTPPGVDHDQLSAGDYSHDWLFGRTTRDCNEELSYAGNMGPDDIEARIFMAVVWVLAALLVWAMPRNDKSELDLVRDTSKTKEAARWDMLDAVRVGAIVAVVCEHSTGTAYSAHNTGFCTMMVIPWLFVVSGIGFGMSKSGPATYFGRLGIVFVVGIGCNLVGDVLGRPGWQDDLGDTIYQMFYVIGITLFALATWPLKKAMRAPAAEDGAYSWPTCALIAYTLVWGGLAGAFLAGVQLVPNDDHDGGRVAQAGWATHMAPLLNNWFFMSAHTSGFLVLVALHRVLDRAVNGALPWLLICYIYIPRVLIPVAFQLAPMMFFFYMLGLVILHHPFAGQERIMEIGRAYWFLVITFMIVFSVPDLLGRCDMYPATTLWERIRWDFDELLLSIALLTRVLHASDPLRIMAPLNYWALFAFVSHVMFARALNTPSFGAAIEFALMPVFVLAWKSYGWFARSSEGAVEAGARGEKSQLFVPLDAVPPDVKGAPANPEGATSATKPYGTFGGLFRKSQAS